MPERVSLPERLLVEKSISKSAKLVWACRRLGLGRRHSGLCRDTYRSAMAQLRTRGWLSYISGGSWASIPSDLLLDRRVGTQARLLYALLQFTPGFSRDSGQFTFTQLCERAGSSRNALKEAVKRLSDAGWLEISRTTKFAPIRFTLNRSAFGEREKEVARVLREYEQAPSSAEGVMQALLSTVAVSRDFVRNVWPGFLINPATGHELELDRYYPPHIGPDGTPVGAVAFEFQGIQHDRTTERFPDEKKLQEQQRRDRHKAAICAQRGIQLVEVRDEDLSLSGMQRKVAGLLPLRNLEENRQLVRVVKTLCVEHRQRCTLLPPTPVRKTS